LQIGSVVGGSGHTRRPASFCNFHFAILNLQFPGVPSFLLFPLAVVIGLAVPGWAAAAGSEFPRGTGFYFDAVKLVAITIVFLAWVRTCAWVALDARPKKWVPHRLWNGIMLGCGLFAFLVVWVLPWFWISFAFLLALWLVPTGVYVHQRNVKLPAEARVLTERHLRELLAYYLGVKIRRKIAPEERSSRVRFLGHPTDSGDAGEAVDEAARLKGFRAAGQLVQDAIKARATEVRLEPGRDAMKVVFLVDGVPQDDEPLSRGGGDGVIRVFKVLSEMEVAEKRKPQDGWLLARMGDNRLHLRVSTAGSTAGERCTLRLLDRSRSKIDLAQLGMDDAVQQQIKELVDREAGLLVVSGPEGSGKHTTLYACLNKVDRFTRNVVTIENPVEAPLGNVAQLELEPRTGQTFASVLADVLREYPEVVMVGDTADGETAHMLCQAAQKQLLLTAVDAPDAAGAITRFIDLGVPPAMAADGLSAVLSQRLVRVLCAKCRIRYRPNPEMLRKANLPADQIKYFYRPPEEADRRARRQAGEDDGHCPACGGSGYRGRIGIFELLVVSDAIRELIRENANPNAIKQEAVKSGMKYIQEDGLRQVIEGKTSVQELLRACK
jgi:type II secretory ATPase GspE/PulE/Tfp pilus assembly ATPase PilB-like protein